MRRPVDWHSTAEEPADEWGDLMVQVWLFVVASLVVLLILWAFIQAMKVELEKARAVIASAPVPAPRQKPERLPALDADAYADEEAATL